MDLMKQKLLRTFFETWEIDKGIASGQISFEDGVPVLRRMIRDFIRPDIKIIDENSYTVLLESVKKINDLNQQRKQEISQLIRVDDDMDKRNLDLKLITEDFNRWHKELLLIQELFDRKQWFIVDKEPVK